MIQFDLPKFTVVKLKSNEYLNNTSQFNKTAPCIIGYFKQCMSILDILQYFHMLLRVIKFLILVQKTIS